MSHFSFLHHSPQWSWYWIRSETRAADPFVWLHFNSSLTVSWLAWTSAATSHLSTLWYRLTITWHALLGTNSCLHFSYSYKICDDGKDSLQPFRAGLKDVGVNTHTFVAHMYAVSLSCGKHTSSYKLWMFSVSITVNQQCMKQPHLLHCLLLFIVLASVMSFHFCLYWFCGKLLFITSISRGKTGNIICSAFCP